MDVDEYIVPSPVAELSHTHTNTVVHIHTSFAQITFLSLMCLTVYWLSNVRKGLREKQAEGDIEKSL